MLHSDDFIEGEQGWSLSPDTGLYTGTTDVHLHGNVVVHGELIIKAEDPG